MPKMKTNKGAAKRFKRTGSGKIKRASGFRRHILTSKTSKRKRQLRGVAYVCKSDENKINRLLCCA